MGFGLRHCLAVKNTIIRILFVGVALTFGWNGHTLGTDGGEASAIKPGSVRTHAETQATCANLLGGSTYRVLLKQAFDLDLVDSPEQIVPLEQLYLQLKDAEWNVPADLRERLTGARNRQYKISEMSEKELRQFYANAVNTLYVRVTELWTVQEVRTQVGPVMDRTTEATLTRLLAQYFSPWRLVDRDLTPEAARAHFKQRAWMMLPWQKIASFVTEWQDRGAGLREQNGDSKFNRAEFSKFWDERAQAYGLSFEMYHRLSLALNRGPDVAVCCHSEPGCVACPHNRRWRRRD